jgi:hypothetical protein
MLRMLDSVNSPFWTINTAIYIYNIYIYIYIIKIYIYLYTINTAILSCILIVSFRILF